MDNPEKLQHREFVQSTLIRMSNHSFTLKGLMITIVAAFIGVYVARTNPIFLLLPIPLIIIIWFLDSRYLQLERKFRGIYEDICDITPKELKKTTLDYEMNVNLYQGKEYNFMNVLFSKTVYPLYSVIILCLLLTYVLVYFE